MIAYAQATGSHITYANQLVTSVKSAILYPLIMLLLGVAILMFLYGIFEMVKGADNAETRANGQRHMLAGIVGIVVMLSAVALLQIAVHTIWGDNQTIQGYLR